MKITRISVYQAKLPYVGGTYCWGLGVEPDLATLGEPVAVYQ